MPSQVTLDGDLKFSPQQVSAAIKRATGPNGVQIPIDFKVNSNLPLGKITGQIKDFDRALDAATDRVVAFGAAAGAFTLISKAIDELISATTEVQEVLIRIGTNFNKTEAEIAQFGKTLFDIARQTGSTFSEAAKGAEELARQGLSIAETQKRLKDALILSRISGTDVNDTIQNLTATLNTFNETGLDSTKIINKLVAVDVSAAVSAKDLQEAFARVGSSAKDAGVSFDQLLSLITVVKERTGRDGAVIGNSLKTIFTRLERPKVLETLEGLGIAVKDAAGETIPAIQILTQLAKTYDTLSDKQKSLVTEQVAGGFQINIIKALLGDLSKETTRYSQVLQIAGNATDAATKKNEQFNTSLKSALNATAQSITQIFSSIGNDKAGGLLTDLLNGFNNFVSKGLSGEKAEGAGKTWAEGFVNGISNVLTGPALVSALLIIGKVFQTVGSRIGQELAGYLSIGDALKNQAAIQSQINELLTKASNEEIRAFYATQDIVKQKEIILALSERIAATDAASLGRNSQLSSLVLREGGIPHFAGGYIGDAVNREASAIRAGIGGASSSAKPVVIPNFNGGGPVVANSSEFIVPNHAGGGNSIFNRQMVAKYGLPNGSIPIAAGGYMSQGRNERGQFISYEDTAIQVKRQEKEEEIILGKKIAAQKRIIAIAEDEERLAKLRIQLQKEVLRTEKLRAKTTFNEQDVFYAGRTQAQQALQSSRNNITPSIVNKQLISEVVKQAEENAQKAAAEILQSNVKVNKGENYKASSESMAAFLASRYGPKYSPTGYKPYDKGLLSPTEDSFINRQTILNKASRSISEGILYNQLPADQRKAYFTQLRKSTAERLYGKDISIDELYAHPTANKEINLSVGEQIRQLSGIGRPSSNLKSIFSDKLSGKAQFAQIFGYGDAEEQLKKLISSGGVKGENIESLRQQATKLNNDRLQRRSNLTLGRAFGLPFAAGFIDDKEGGTAGGIIRGGIKGAANLGGPAALFGPEAEIGGLVIGGLVGAFSKLTKSVSEFEAQIDKTTANGAKQIDAGQKAFQLLESYKSARSSGNESQARQLFSQFQTSLGAVQDPKLRSALFSQDSKKIEDALSLANTGQSLVERRADISKGFLGDLNNKDAKSDLVNKIASLNLSSNSQFSGGLQDLLKNKDVFNFRHLQQYSSTDSFGSPQFGLKEVGPNRSQKDAEEDLNKFSEALKAAGFDTENLKLNLSNASSFLSVFSEGLKENAKVNKELAGNAGALGIQLKGFLSGGLKGSGASGAFGGSLFRKSNNIGGNPQLSAYERDSSFLNIIDELKQSDPANPLYDIGQNKNIRSATTNVQRKNLFSSGADFLTQKSGGQIGYRNPDTGLPSEILVRQGLDRLSKSEDGQTADYAKILLSKIANSDTDLSNLNPSGPSKPGKGTIIKNGGVNAGTYDSTQLYRKITSAKNFITREDGTSVDLDKMKQDYETNKKVGGTAQFKGKEYTGSELSVLSKSLISPKEAGLGRKIPDGPEDNITKLEKAIQELAQLITVLTAGALNIRTINSIGVDIKLSPEALKQVMDQDGADMFKRVKAKFDELQTELNNMKSESKTGVPIPPRAYDQGNPISATNGEF